MTKLVDEIQRGHEAEKLINNPLFEEAFNKVKDSLIQAMNDSPLGDEKTHNRLVIGLQLLNQIEKQIKSHIATGKMAKIQSSGGVLMKIQGIA